MEPRRGIPPKRQRHRHDHRHSPTPCGHVPGVEGITADAASYEFADDTTVVSFANAFDVGVLDAVLEHIGRSWQRRTRPLAIVGDGPDHQGHSNDGFAHALAGNDRRNSAGIARTPRQDLPRASRRPRSRPASCSSDMRTPGADQRRMSHSLPRRTGCRPGRCRDRSVRPRPLGGGGRFEDRVSLGVDVRSRQGGRSPAAAGATQTNRERGR